MSELSEREIAVFNAALQLPAEQRADYLEQACQGEKELRQRLEVLLQAHTLAGAFLVEPVISVKALKTGRTGEDRGGAAAHAEKPGDQIGRYKLIQPIGEGGCGVVYLAEQEEPVRRHVALKVIKLGMDTKSVIARFEAERQALAMMDHPNIAKVFDAGATETGRPFFVMELVRGLKITEFCDQNSLSTRARLDLLVLVCRAVQHAHQKGIIHRDLKPSNILVTVNDGIPVPKVIDFGIAKATQGRLTNQTVVTAFEQFIGTPAYMSPEQISLTSLDVDTRSDIYSLGVLLYEILTGQTPFNQQELLSAGLEEMRRMIREKEPPRPSTRLSALRANELTTIARNRQSEPPRLVHTLNGDLDWIVMKCLEKERARRYETADGLALDLSRHLNNEPVLARPYSVAYRTAKFIRRHRGPVSSACVITLAIIGGLVGTIVQSIRATEQAAIAETNRRRADAAAQTAEGQRAFAVRQLSRAESLNDLNTFLLSDAAPSGKPFTVGELLAQAEQLADRASSDSEENRVEIMVSVGHQYEIQDEQAKAREVLAKAYAISRNLTEPSIRAKAAAALGSAVALGGDFARGEALLREALDEIGDAPQFALQRVFVLARGSRVAREAEQPLTALDRILTAQRLLKESGQGSALMQLGVLGDVAESYRVAGQLREAANGFAQAFAQLTALGRENTERAGTFLNNWGLVLGALGKPLDAEQLFRRAIAISSADGTDERVSPMLLVNLARELFETWRLPEAADYAERAYAKAQRAGDEIVVGQALSVRAHIHRDRGQLEQCEAVLTELAAHWQRILPSGHGAFASLASHYAKLALARGDIPAALAASDQAIKLATASGAGRDALPMFLIPRAGIELRAGRLEEALTTVIKAIALEETIAGSEAQSCWVGRAQLTKGRILAAQGQRELARTAFALAREHLQLTVGADHPETREAIQGAAAQ